MNWPNRPFFNFVLDGSVDRTVLRREGGREGGVTVRLGQNRVFWAKIAVPTVPEGFVNLSQPYRRDCPSVPTVPEGLSICPNRTGGNWPSVPTVPEGCSLCPNRIKFIFPVSQPYRRDFYICPNRIKEILNLSQPYRREPFLSQPYQKFWRDIHFFPEFVNESVVILTLFPSKIH